MLVDFANSCSSFVLCPILERSQNSFCTERKTREVFKRTRKSKYQQNFISYIKRLFLAKVLREERRVIMCAHRSPRSNSKYSSKYSTLFRFQLFLASSYVSLRCLAHERLFVLVVEALNHHVFDLAAVP